LAKLGLCDVLVDKRAMRIDDLARRVPSVVDDGMQTKVWMTIDHGSTRLGEKGHIDDLKL